MKKVGFIGVGNMGSALLRGMLADGALLPENALTFDADAGKNARLAGELGVTAAAGAEALARDADLIILAVKPDAAHGVLRGIRPALDGAKILLSVVLGLDIRSIGETTGGRCRVVRCMPNTPALVGAGVMCLAFGDGFDAGETERVSGLFSSCGMAEVMEERHLERVTALTGSSPAYVFIMLEAMADAAVRNGLPRAIARRLAAQAVLGSAKMALETGTHPAELKDGVCSPGGSTIEAVRVLESRGFRSALIEAMIVCDAKAGETGRFVPPPGP
ncbi:MAG: pyrroline-5-carboxylate reductase [Oscillospiraceae bacterium]|jgi:pyrroline-5-carboxylate reductase|nr:pyrroline-5-carboxylate reductase [Oscillospiraceae bacterium]